MKTRARSFLTSARVGYARASAWRGGACACRQPADNEARFMHVVLLEPEIPPNTGNVARLCAATGTVLHLVEPFGFKLDDAALKRAGMDYWRHVDWRRWANWQAFRDHLPAGARLWFVESNGPKVYSSADFLPDDYLVFGRETAGLPRVLLNENPQRWLRIPMFNPQARSLNLSNCVALVLFEALRQQGFAGELPPVTGSLPPGG